MKRPHRLLYFVLIAIAALPASLLRADLSGDVRAVLNDKLLSKGEVGVEIVRLGSAPADAHPIFEYKATVPRIPASNLKLLTTATAMEKLGADFQFKTVFAARGPDVAIIGDGDPTLGDAEMLKKVGWGVDTVFKSWADLLKKHGVTEVRNVYVDDSIFDQEFVHPDWPTDQLHKRYVAQVAGVNLNANCLDFYLRIGSVGDVVQYRTDPVTNYATIGNTCVTGSQNAVWLSRKLGGNEIVLRGETNASNDEPVSVTIDDPPMYAATVLAETLEANGVKVSGEVLRDRTIRSAMLGKPTSQPAAADAPATAPSTNPVADQRPFIPIAIHATPLMAVISRANKDSMNLYAEALCKRIGAASTGASGSWQSGIAVSTAFLQSLGVSSDEYSLDDGCGLSKKNTISPHAIATILEHEFYDKDHEKFMNSLAVAGIDGTFEHRFGTDLRGRVFGKSGYVNGVSTLSGYVKAKDGQWYVFSILFNDIPPGTVLGAKQLQEKIVKAIDAQASSDNVAAGN